MALGVELVQTVSLVVMLVGTLFSLAVVYRFSDDRPLAALRRRLLLAVPWGTALVVCGLFFVFYVIQGAAVGEAKVVPFRSWSLFYPLGMLVAPFAHNGSGHLVGNVLNTVAFAPVVEYVWSHYPVARGSESFSSWRTNPYVRVGLFVVGVAAVGLATSLFTPGALIGFSGVVFAFAGFALVTRPLLTVFAILASRVVSQVYFALQFPVATPSAQTRVVTPFFANVAIQGHALGLLIGIMLGLWLVSRRDDWPDVRYVWFAALVFAITQSLYALYVPLSTDTFVFLRGVGTAAVFLLAAVVAVALSRSDRLLVERIDLWRREVAVGILLAFLLAISVAAIPYNLATISATHASDSGVQVRDYQVTYVEGVSNQYIEAVNIPIVDRALSVNESGVLVTSEKRNAWEIVLSKRRLAVRGRTVFPVGGLGWRETIIVNRTTWSVIDGGSTYKVYVRKLHERRHLAFADKPVMVPAIINGSRIRIAPTRPGYAIQIVENGSVVASKPMPRAGWNRTLADITFNRTGKSLVAIHDRTVVRIATFELKRPTPTD